MPRYKLNLSTQQSHVLVNALDLYARLGMCQFEIIGESLIDIGVLEFSDEKFSEKRDAVDELLKKLKAVFGHAPNSSLGITGARELSRIAYDIECVLRKEIARREQHESFSVWHHDPLHTARNVPLAEVSSED